jgi:hypothetical protein
MAVAHNKFSDYTKDEKAKMRGFKSEKFSDRKLLKTAQDQPSQKPVSS